MNSNLSKTERAEALILVIAISLMGILLVSKVETLERQVEKLDARNQFLTEHAVSICQSLYLFGQADDQLTSLTNSPNAQAYSDLYDKILFAQAYCAGAVAYHINSGPFRIDLVGNSFTLSAGNSARGYLSPAQFKLKMYSDDGSLVNDIDFTSYVEVGDFVSISILPAKPNIVSFYDEKTGLAILIQHIGGNFETITP